MNQHLEPIFKILIPNIEKSGLSYWVYGGVAIAGVKGNFYRVNADIDIFVLEKDYKKVINNITATSDRNLWIFKPAKLLNNRPKSELIIENKERLSIVPIYERGNEIEFIFENGPKIFARKLLNPVIRYIGEYKFITPSEDLLKELLRCYLESFFKSERRKNNKILWEKRKLDVEQLFGEQESKRLFIEPLI
ncbi:MAG: hypothetical protein AABY32_06260 [Nanoarchaeota archaeon]